MEDKGQYQLRGSCSADRSSRGAMTSGANADESKFTQKESAVQRRPPGHERGHVRRPAGRRKLSEEEQRSGETKSFGRRSATPGRAFAVPVSRVVLSLPRRCPIDSPDTSFAFMSDALRPRSCCPSPILLPTSTRSGGESPGTWSRGSALHHSPHSTSTSDARRFRKADKKLILK